MFGHLAKAFLALAKFFFGSAVLVHFIVELFKCFAVPFFGFFERPLIVDQC